MNSPSRRRNFSKLLLFFLTFSYYNEAVRLTKRFYVDKDDSFHNAPIQPNTSKSSGNSDSSVDFEKQLQQEYKNEVRKKEVEITQLQRSLLKDSMRIAFFELGNIHYQYGYVGESIKAWIKSHDFSTSEEDLFNIAYQIAQAAFEIQSSSYLMKFSGEADARDKLKNPSKTMVIKILDGLSCLLFESYKEASLRLSSISLVDDNCIYRFVTPTDLAYYITIVSLYSMTRKEMKQMVLQSSQFKNLMEIVPETTDIIENFLNGKYMEFQRSLSSIQSHLRLDLFFGHKLEHMITNIRRKALVQYVTPYKVIDLREIAKEFNLDLELIESEIADLIVNSKIQAKIDSHSKLLYSRKDNETLNSYKEAVLLGRKFIQDTEQTLLRVQLLQKNKILKPQNALGHHHSNNSNQ
jgi:COP9 signalosome complex subunit 1